MILKSLSLQNIRSYANQKIEFPLGSVLLSGDIGSGKSSILLGIEFALFGTNRSQLPASSVLRKGEQTGSVELTLSIDGKEVIVKRTLKRVKDDIKQDSGYVIVNGIKTEGTPVELRSMILNLVSYPPEMLSKTKDFIYRYTVYTPQEQMKYILSSAPEERLDTIRKVFGIDKYKQIRENLSLLSKLLKEKALIYKGETGGLEEKNLQLSRKTDILNEAKQKLLSSKATLDDAKKQVLSQKESMASTEKTIETIKELTHQLALQDTSLQEKVQQSTQYSKQLVELNTQISNLTQLTQGTEELLAKEESKIQEQIHTTEIELQKMQNSMQGHLTQKSIITTQLDAHQKWLNDNENKTLSLKEKQDLFDILHKEVEKKESLQSTLTDSENQLLEKTRVIESICANKAVSEKTMTDIESLDNCPTCLQTVPSTHKDQVVHSHKRKVSEYTTHLKEHTQSKAELQKQINLLKEHLHVAMQKEQELTVLKMQVQTLRDLQTECDEKKQLINQLISKQKEVDSQFVNEENMLTTKARLQELKKDLQHAQEHNKKVVEINHLKQQLSDKTQAKEDIQSTLTSLKKMVGEINSKKTGLQNTIKQYGDVQTKYEEMKKQLEEKQHREQEAAMSVVSLEKECDSITLSLNELHTEIEKKKTAQKKLTTHLQHQNWIDNSVINMMHAIERAVLLKVYHEFNELFTEWFVLLMEDESMQARLDENFTPIVEQNGYEISVSHLSGGERTACALAYRLALNKVINDVMSKIKTKDLIILDEPTDGFSSQQLDRVREVLDELNTQQTILVSHESKIESFVDHVIRVEKQSHESVCYQ